MSKNIRGFSNSANLTINTLDLTNITTGNLNANTATFTGTVTFSSGAQYTGTVEIGTLKLPTLTTTVENQSDEILFVDSTHKVVGVGTFTFNPFTNTMSINNIAATNLTTTGEITYKGQTLDNRFIQSGGASGVVTLAGVQTITGEKIFSGGLKLTNVPTDTTGTAYNIPFIGPNGKLSKNAQFQFINDTGSGSNQLSVDSLLVPGDCTVNKLILTTMGNSSETTNQILMRPVDAQGNDLEVRADSDMTYNASTNTLTCPNITATAVSLGGSDLQGSLNAIQTNTTAIAGNTTSITANATAIAGNTTTIAGNTTSITANATAISGNTTTISGNTTAITANTTDIAGKVSKTGNETISGAKTFNNVINGSILGNVAGNVVGNVTGSVQSASNLSASPPSPVDNSFETANLRIFNHEPGNFGSGNAYIYGAIKATGFNAPAGGTPNVNDLSKIGYNMAFWNDGHIRFQYKNQIIFYGTNDPSANGTNVAEMVRIGINISRFKTALQVEDRTDTTKLLNLEIDDSANNHGAFYTTPTSHTFKIGTDWKLRVTSNTTQVYNDLDIGTSSANANVTVNGDITLNTVQLSSVSRDLNVLFHDNDAGDKRLKEHNDFNFNPSSKTLSVSGLQLTGLGTDGSSQDRAVPFLNSSNKFVKSLTTFTYNQGAERLSVKNIATTGEITYKGETLDARFGGAATVVKGYVAAYSCDMWSTSPSSSFGNDNFIEHDRTNANSTNPRISQYGQNFSVTDSGTTFRSAINFQHNGTYWHLKDNSYAGWWMVDVSVVYHNTHNQRVTPNLRIKKYTGSAWIEQPQISQGIQYSRNDTGELNTLRCTGPAYLSGTGDLLRIYTRLKIGSIPNTGTIFGSDTTTDFKGNLININMTFLGNSSSDNETVNAL